jgi:hypothetical protein
LFIGFTGNRIDNLKGSISFIPSSSISWLDFSEAERRKMVEIVSLFKERDTRDELGYTKLCCSDFTNSYQFTKEGVSEPGRENT